MNHADIIAAITTMGSAADKDPAMARTYWSLLNTHCPSILALGAKMEIRRAFPDPDEIVAAQCALWDNWRHTGGRKPNRKRGEEGARKDRFKVTVEVWTKRDEQFDISTTSPTFTMTAPLLTGAEMKKKLEKTYRTDALGRPFADKSMIGEDGMVHRLDRDGPEWKRYGDELEAMGDAPGGPYRAGPFCTMGGGTHFLLDTYALAREDDIDGLDDPKIIVASPLGHLTFDAFDTCYSTKKAFAGNLVLQSRLAAPGLFPKWRTSVLK